MTPKEISDLKITYNRLLDEGRDLYEQVAKIHKQMTQITKTLIEVEGDEYDGVPLIFGAGYWINPDLIDAL